METKGPIDWLNSVLRGDFYDAHSSYLPFDISKLQAIRDRLIEAEKMDEVIEQLRYKINSIQLQNHALIKELCHIKMLLKPDCFETPDGKRYEFYPPDDLLRQMWDGLSRAIKSIPDLVKMDLKTESEYFRALYIALNKVNNKSIRPA